MSFRSRYITREKGLHTGVTGEEKGLRDVEVVREDEVG